MNKLHTTISQGRRRQDSPAAAAPIDARATYVMPDKCLSNDDSNQLIVSNGEIKLDNPIMTIDTFNSTYKEGDEDEWHDIEET